MGRITPSFRTRYLEIEELKENYYNRALIRDNKQAFDLLLKEAWDKEQVAMGNSKNIVSVLDESTQQEEDLKRVRNASKT